MSGKPHKYEISVAVGRRYRNERCCDVSQEIKNRTRIGKTAYVEVAKKIHMPG